MEITPFETCLPIMGVADTLELGNVYFLHEHLLYGSPLIMNKIFLLILHFVVNQELYLFNVFTKY